ncbi:MAG: nickel pincer cofactor biosynthesis protein LarC [Chloroflexi bacterium]|nr:MAG: nickel pincer cofactor biosynthesis protein LarC [Chloroflexota bacterium]TMG29929.1 MAG: nickel pincer cofactor biosynthesis protein LarC [Chloroflexota bacterium]
MKQGSTIAYFDCFAGISGDMTLGALIDAGGDRAVLDAAVEALRLGDEVKIDIRHESRGHAGGTRILVGVAERVERTVPALRRVIEDSEAPDAVKSPALDAIDRLARAEAQVHNAPMEQAHLHELSGADTLVDVVGAFWLLHALDVGRVYASPLPAPRGLKNDMPLPAPASLRVLEGTGAVFQPTNESRELVTPTGAAILAATATFERPAMSLRRIGYGIGAHNAPGNALAVWIGDEVAAETGVILVETNLDDMAPNLIAALTEDLMAAGALDVTVVPALMKKGRPGHVLTVMSPPELVARLSDHLLRHSTTLGLRLTPVQRVIAGRMVIEVTTPIGSARVKVKELDGKPVDVAPEYEDCRRIARERGIDLREVMRVVAESARRQVGLD